MSRMRNRKWLCLWCAAVACAAGTIAYAAQTLRVVPIVHNNEVLVSFEVPDGYTSDVRDAIASGLRTTFSYDVQVRMHATMWVDPLVEKATISVSDRYDNLTRQHTLTRTVDGRDQSSTTTESEAVVRQWLTSFDRLVICKTTKLVPNRDYYVQVSARVVPDHTSILGLSSAVVGRSPFTFIP